MLQQPTVIVVNQPQVIVPVRAVELQPAHDCSGKRPPLTANARSITGG